MVGFKIDLTYGGITGCDRLALMFFEDCLGGFTSCLLPEVSLSASRPPGPMLLLRFFFTTCFPCTLKFAFAPRSILAFSWFPVIYAEGVCAIDLRAWRARGGLGLGAFDDMLAILQVLLHCTRQLAHRMSSAAVYVSGNLARRIRGNCKQ